MRALIPLALVALSLLTAWRIWLAYNPPKGEHDSTTRTLVVGAVNIALWVAAGGAAVVAALAAYSVARSILELL